MMTTYELLRLPVKNSSESTKLNYCFFLLLSICYHQFDIRIYLTSSIFLRLQTISGFPGHVNIMSLFNYTMRKVWLQQTRIGLSLYDYTGQGFLRETVSSEIFIANDFNFLTTANGKFKHFLQDLESYILELIPTLPQLEGLEKSFHSFYVCTAVRKFFFFLDSQRTGRIRIRDVLACSFLEDLLEVSFTNTNN